MKTSLCLLFAVLWALPGPCRGAAASFDLGMGLTYHRLHELPADIPKAVSAGARVLDLRFLKADASSGAALAAWLRFNASARAPLFILENAESSGVLKALALGPHPNVIFLAPDASGVQADILVAVSAAADRKAYEALEKGFPIAGLLSDNPQKERVDEAYLEKEHLSDSDAPEPGGDRPEPPGPLVDLLLQRAVQLHRGLLALKKL